MSKQSTLAELIVGCVLAGGCCISTYLAWRSGTYLALVVMIPLSLLFLWGVVDMLRQGGRKPTDFERFETGLLTRFLLIVCAGGAAVFLLNWAGYGAGAVVLLLVVLVMALVSAGKLRRNNETSAGYKQRVGYRDPEQRQTRDINER